MLKSVKASKKIIIALTTSALMIIVIISAALFPKSRSGSPYETIILNASNIKIKEYPLRRFISDKSIEKIKFLGPEALKDNIRTIIVVLGDRPLGRTTPTVNMAYRVLKGVELYRKYPGSILIMSGGTTAGDISEAEMMGLIAWSRGVDPSRILLEYKSRNTEQNAEFTANIVRSKNIGRKFVVTDQLRIERAVRIFRNYFREFKDVQGVDCGIPIKSIAGQDASAYGKIISNTGKIRDTEFPVRNSISGKETAKVEFLNSQKLKNDVKTAIFVLPNRPLDDVTPSIDSVYRALKAVELAKKYPDSILIMLGPKTVGDISEAQMMALAAWSRGIEASRIVVEDRARSKEDKAEFIAEMIRNRNITRAFIIAKKEHIQRIIPFFQNRYKEEFKNAEGIDCGVTKDMIIAQMEEYLKANDDKVVRRRINNVKKGRIGID